MVRVCDAIMGSGKTEASITYINEHPDERFIYITPYLEQAERIKNSCCQAHFVEPSNKIKEYEFKKTLHTAALIRDGKNITTTHQAFREYTSEMLSDIRDKGYTLIIDENVDLLGAYDINKSDLDLVVSSGRISYENDVYKLVDASYDGVVYKDLFHIMRSRYLEGITFDGMVKFYYWILPPELITSFKDVYILTYMFSGQSIDDYLRMNCIPYSFIGIERPQEHEYRFSESSLYTPEYLENLPNMIHIIDKPKLNAVGENKYALSQTWFERGGTGVDQLRKNMSNCFRNIWSDSSADQRLWGSYVMAKHKLRGKGYSNSFLPFNARATNAYRDKDHLIYASNVYMNVNDKLFYSAHGILVDEDAYALSTMIQWIWRSAIRDGKEIYLYIPSSRMRSLLLNWIDSFKKGV